ncbi:hypothetical protein [Haloimpatiens lingqiaonensis]|nr:hypothetical protein [Haloimpatiens lingqiaonensis]
MAFEVLVNINSLVEEALNLSNRARSFIRKVENELSIDSEYY